MTQQDFSTLSLGSRTDISYRCSHLTLQQCSQLRIIFGASTAFCMLPASLVLSPAKQTLLIETAWNSVSDISQLGSRCSFIATVSVEWRRPDRHNDAYVAGTSVLWMQRAEGRSHKNANLGFFIFARRRWGKSCRKLKAATSSYPNPELRLLFRNNKSYLRRSVMPQTTPNLVYSICFSLQKRCVFPAECISRVFRNKQRKFP